MFKFFNIAHPETKTPQEHQISQLEAEILRLKSVNESSSEISALKATVASLEARIKVQEQKYEVLELEQEDLLLCLADQEVEMEELRDRLRRCGQTVSDQ